MAATPSLTQTLGTQPPTLTPRLGPARPEREGLSFSLCSALLCLTSSFSLRELRCPRSRLRGHPQLHGWPRGWQHPSHCSSGGPHWLMLQTAYGADRAAHRGAHVDPVTSVRKAPPATKPRAHSRQRLSRLQCRLRAALVTAADVRTAPAGSGESVQDREKEQGSVTELESRPAQCGLPPPLSI